MNSQKLHWFRAMTLAAACLTSSGPVFCMAQEAKPVDAAAAKPASTEANQAWEELQKALRPANPPAEWATQKPSAEAQAEFNKKNGALAGEAAVKARAFYEKFPHDARAKEAQRRELNLLKVAVQTGQTNYAARLQALEKGTAPEASQNATDKSEATEEARFMAQVRTMQKAARQAQDAIFEKHGLQLLKEFPNRSDIYELIADVASRAEPAKAQELARLILASKVAGEEVKEAAQSLLKKADLLGRPVEIKFTAMDGREVDVAKMKGKVVLIDFWATWCGPCVQEMPNVKAAYAKLNQQGFEIVGISLDQKKTALERFVTDEKIPWPQYFDGQGWGNKIARQYGINSIPAMWLVDKKGNLRDTEAGEGLVEKVEKLLAEK